MRLRSYAIQSLAWTLGLSLTNCSSSKPAEDENLQAAKSPIAASIGNASTDPQLFGFGYAQLALFDGSKLQGLAPPVRVQNTPWTTRWLSTMSLAPTVVVAGDFWHAPDGKAYMLGIKGSAVTAFEPPEVASTAAWAAKGSAQTLPGLPSGETIKDAAAGDFLNLKRDQLVVLTATHVIIYTPPATPGGAWVKSSDVAAPSSNATGIAAGEFWSGTSNSEEARYRSKFVRQFGERALYDQGIGRGPRGQDQLCLLKSDGHLEFYNWISTGGWVLNRTDARVVSGKIASGDFLKRGRDAIAVVATGTSKKIDIYEAPVTSGGQSTLLVSGTFDKVPSSIVDVTADRLFGYVDQTVDSNNRRGSGQPNGVDLEVAFLERTPVYRRYHRNPQDVDNHYGWPLLNETVSYTAYVKNNGTVTAAANSASIKLWANMSQRNADILGTAATKTQTITTAIPPFDPTKPYKDRYVKVPVTLPWPYDLITENGNPWKKLNVAAVGERWTIASVSHASDVNRRNDRAETALASWLFHPMFAGTALADRQANVGGDPASREYQMRKLADSLNMAWGRSHAGDNSGAAVRVAMDGYDVVTEWQADPSTLDQKNYDVEDYYEGPRGVGGTGLQNAGGTWETGTYCTGDGDEMHETGHEFQGVDDLYQYVVEPSRTGSVKMGNGKIPQWFTSVWQNDEMSNNCNVFSETQTLIIQHAIGMRNVGHPGWHQIMPKKIYVKVLDRFGNPVSGAKLALWRQYDTQAHATGTTDSTGTWDTGHPYGETPTYDSFYNEPHYSGPDALTGDGSPGVWITAEVNGYVDAAVLGATSEPGTGVLGSDRHSAFGRVTFLEAYHANPDSYTWTFRTNYAPSASAFTKQVSAVVEGTQLAVLVNGTGTFKLYKQRPPSYERVLVGPFAGGTPYIDSIAAVDAFGETPGRALYEITEVVGSTESLPYQLAIQSTSIVAGISDLGSGKLLVATKPAGNNSTFLSTFQGTAPEREYVYDFRWGHRAVKAVKSLLTSDRYYVALADADYGWENDTGGQHRFEVFQPIQGTQAACGFETNTDQPIFSGTANSISGTTITMSGVDFLAQGVNVGDYLVVNEQQAVITSVSVGQIVASGPAFTLADAPWTNVFSVTMHAGAPGSDKQSRQLQSIGGLDALLDATSNAEHIAIADPTAGRVVFWDSKTRFVVDYPESGFVPKAVVHHPLKVGEVFVLSRPTGANASLLELKLAGGVVSLVKKFALGVTLGNLTEETGLAAIASGTDVMLAVTDGSTGRVFEYKLASGASTLTAVKTYTDALQPVVSSTSLMQPLDVTYSTVGSVTQLFASDASTRVVALTPAGSGGTGGTAGTGGASSTGGAKSTGGATGAGGASSTGGTRGSGGANGTGGAIGTGGATGGSGLKVQYRAGDTNTTDNQIKPYLNIVNTGTVSIPWSQIKVRYWYTNEGGVAQTASCDYAVMSCANITRTISTVSPARTGADTYLELSFSSAAGNLAAGAQSGEMQIRINKNDWSNYNEANDYSFDATKTAYADFTKITVYRNGVLVWGTEP